MLIRCCDLLLPNRLRVTAPRTLQGSGFLLGFCHFTAWKWSLMEWKYWRGKAQRKGSKLIRNSEFRICL